MKYLWLTLLLAISMGSHAAVYLQTDKDGNVSYTDTPAGKVIQLDHTNSSAVQPEPIVNPSTATTQQSDPNPALVERKPYRDFYIREPLDQQTFQNQREIPVQLYVRPLLQKEDKAQLYLDGVPVGEPVAYTSLMLRQLDRGTHSLYAVLWDKEMRMLKQTNSIVIYVHYAHVPARS